MENEEIQVEVPIAAPSPDTKNRLEAAREFAVEQYEKIRRAAAAQFETVRKYTKEARAKINDGWDVTCSKAKELHKAGEEYVKANPTTSVLGALGLGVLVGLLLGSSRR